jgi:hypothetical protein
VTTSEASASTVRTRARSTSRLFRQEGRRSPPELRGLEPLTPCMPNQQSRYQLRSAQTTNTPSTRRQGVLRGAEGTRTPDPLHAMQVRYQLRHSPKLVSPGLCVSGKQPE